MTITEYAAFVNRHFIGASSAEQWDRVADAVRGFTQLEPALFSGTVPVSPTLTEEALCLLDGLRALSVCAPVNVHLLPDSTINVEWNRGGKWLRVNLVGDGKIEVLLTDGELMVHYDFVLPEIVK
jgi:hypothetical protein